MFSFSFFFFFEIKFQNGAHMKKRDIFDLLFTFLVTRKELQFSSFSTYLTHIHTCILLTLLTFFALPILKNTNLSGMVSLWYHSWC